MAHDRGNPTSARTVALRVVMSAFVVVAWGVPGSRAAHAEDADARGGRDTSRLAVAVSAVMFASYPRSIEDPGPAVSLGKPLWLGRRHRYVQWSLGAALLGGYGTASRHGHLAVGPQVGLDLYLGSVVGLEVRVGVAGIAQIGSRSVVGAGLFNSGGYVFRFWDDDRRRVKLVMTMHVGGYFASDPGNDLGMNANALGVGVAYEAPL